MKKLIEAKIKMLSERYASFDMMISEVERKGRVEVTAEVQKRAIEALVDVEKLFSNVSAYVSDVMINWKANGEIKIVFLGVPNSLFFCDRYATTYLKRELHEATRAIKSYLWVWPDYYKERNYKLKIELLITP